MPYNLPPAISYPLGIDSDDTLYLVFNTAEAMLTENNPAWSDEIVIEPSEGSEQWADNGFANISGELFYYGSVERDVDNKVYKLKRCARNLGGTQTKHNETGTMVRGYVVAEHHNQLANATIAVEQFVGYNFNTNQATLDWRIRNLADIPICIDDNNCPEVDFRFVLLDDNATVCDGVSSYYIVNITGNYSSYSIDFGDGSSSTALSGSHVYGLNSKIDPVVVVSNDLCQIIVTPSERENPEEPTTTVVEPFAVPIPEIPDFSPPILPQINVPSTTLTLPQIIFPCLDVIGPIGPINVPSVIVVSPPIPPTISFGPVNIPSSISFGAVTIPSLINFGPVSIIGFIPSVIAVIDDIPHEIEIIGTIPSQITFVNTPSFTSQISFVNSPTIPPQISFVNNPTVPSQISLIVPPTISLIVPPTISLTGLRDISLIGQPSNISLIYGGPSVISLVFDPANIPSVISFANLPNIPANISFQNLPTIPDEILFGSITVPDMTIQFGANPLPSTIYFGENPMPSTIYFDCCDIPSTIFFGPAPAVTVEWGQVPTISIIVQCTTVPALNALNLNSSFQDTITRAAVADSTALGIPEEIRLVVPKIPDIRVTHDIPDEIKLSMPDIPTVSLLHNIPNTINVAQEHIIPNTINIVAEGLPSRIILEVPESIRLDVPEFPTITFNTSNIPSTIQVVGVPESIELKGYIPSEIMIKAPENLEVPLVYKGGPIPIKLDTSALEGNGDQPCFAIVPCNR